MLDGKVLLVTDDSRIIAWVRGAFSGFHSVVEVSPNPLHALEYMNQASPDLVLVDATVDDLVGPCLRARLNTEPQLMGVPVVELVPDHLEHAVGRYRLLQGVDSIVPQSRLNEVSLWASRGPRGPPARHAAGTELPERTSVRPPRCADEVLSKRTRMKNRD